MGDEKNVANDLLQQSKAELSFRQKIVELIGGVLRSDAPNYFKAFVVILLFLALSASFILVTLFVGVIHAMVSGGTLLHLPMFVGIFTMHGFAAVLLGAPLILRMAAFEESKRLEADLVKIQSIRKRRDGVRSVGKSVGH